MLFGVLLLVAPFRAWQRTLSWPRPTPPVGVDAGALPEIAALESALGVTVRVTLDPHAEVHGKRRSRTLYVGLPLVAELSAPVLLDVCRGALHARPSRRARFAERLDAVDAEMDSDPFNLAWRWIVRRLAHRLRVPALPGHAFDPYWHETVGPVLDAGFRPPIAAGWCRIVHGEAPPPGEAEQWAEIEARLLATRPGGSGLVPIEWERTGVAVWLPLLRGDARVAALVAAAWDVVFAPENGLWMVEPESGAAVDLFTLVSEGDWPVLAEALGVDADVPLEAEPASEDDAVAVGTRPVELELRLSAPARATAKRRCTLTLALGLPAIALVLWTAFSIPDDPTVLPFCSVSLALTVITMALGLHHWTRLLRTPGRVRIDDESVVIDHPALLRAPWRTTRAHLRAVAFDEWADGVRAIPMIGRADDVPNVVLVFTERLTAPRMRHAGYVNPLKGEGVGGLLLCAGEEAGATLADAGWLNTLSREDAAVLNRALLGD